MSDLLLHTKLNRPPIRATYVARPHLWQQLDRLLIKKLALISAPAGFGKTLLLTSWLEHLQTNPQRLDLDSPPGIGWIHLDEGDNDPVQFMRYLLAALRQAGQDPDQLPQIEQENGPPPLRTVFSRLVNAFSQQTRPVIIVLDDYHTIENQRIHQEMAFWLGNMPKACHLVIASRADPPLQLSQLRVRQELVEIRARELRLDKEEAAELLNGVMELSLTDHSVKLLVERTEGWAAGLQLAALALQGRTPQRKQEIVAHFGEGHMFVIDYFLEQVWSRIAAPMKDFLLDTSILEKLSGPLCDAVTGGDAHGQLNLEELQRQNLFTVGLDSERRWYRYHQLFAGLLRARLQQEKGTNHVQTLHHRASIWYSQEGLPDEAINHALKAGDLTWAAELVAAQAPVAQAQGRLKTILGWLAALPDRVKRQHPRLLIVEGQALFLTGQIEEAQKGLFAARRLLQGLEQAPDKDALLGQLATQLAIIAAHFDDPARVISEAEEALAHLPQESLAYRARASHILGVGYGLQGDTRRLVDSCLHSSQLAEKAGHPFLRAHILQLLGSAQVNMGKLQEAARTYRQVIDQDRMGKAQPPYAGLGLIGLAEVQLEWMDIERAATNLTQGIALCERGGIGYNLLGAHCLAVRLAQASRDGQKAEEELAAAEKWLRANPVAPLSRVQYATCAARFWMDQGELGRARELLKEPLSGAGEIQADALPIVIREYYLSVLGLLRLHLGRQEEVGEIYKVILSTAEAAGRLARVLEISLQWALACRQMGHEAEAIKTLEQALQIAGPSGYRLLFWEHGPPMQRLLTHYLSTSSGDASTRDHAATLLQQFAPQRPQASASRSRAGISAELIEPLSEREVEVLGLICRGLSNKAIAGQLSISLNTVKKHTSHIYGKLQVNGRTQAIARAHELHLVV